MNEQLQKLLEALTVRAEATEEFLLEQMPLVAQEYIAYGRVYETFIFVGTLLLIVAYPILISKCWKWFDNLDTAGWDEDINTLVGVVYVVNVVCSIVFCFLIGGGLSHFGTCVKVWFAPRLYLIEELAKLVN